MLGGGESLHGSVLCDRCNSSEQQFVSRCFKHLCRISYSLISCNTWAQTLTLELGTFHIVLASEGSPIVVCVDVALGLGWVALVATYIGYLTILYL